MMGGSVYVILKIKFVALMGVSVIPLLAGCALKPVTLDPVGLVTSLVGELRPVTPNTEQVGNLVSVADALTPKTLLL
jgi:hypothetical protein